MNEGRPRNQYRRLMRDHGDLPAPGCERGFLDRRKYAGLDIGEGLAPRGPQGIAEVPPPAGVTKHSHERAAEPLEGVGALREALVGDDLEVVRQGDDLGGFLGALQGADPNRPQVGPGEVIGGGLSLEPAKLREVVAGQASVDDSLRVLDLTMTHQM